MVSSVSLPPRCIDDNHDTMSIQRGKIISGGRIQLPADVRRQLSLADGDTVLIEVVDGEVRLCPMKESIRRMQVRMRPYIIEGQSIVDELIADRRAEARAEAQDE